jgi:predicted dehydrogenase
MRVKILGAGSIGNHLANACRREGLEVVICDIDEQALARTRHEIYPSRYGKWDEGISLAKPANHANEIFDITIIGTPPNTHTKLAIEELESKTAPKILLIEKPLCSPNLQELERIITVSKSSKTKVLVGYNHRLTAHTHQAAKLIAEQQFSNPMLLNVGFQESWKGIFSAHPWLSGPTDSYLGFWERGGGAGGEHSHGINLWQYFAELTGMGRVTEVSALIDYVNNGGASYDRVFHLNLRTEKGLIGSLFQDVITFPSKKWLTLQFDNGSIEWVANKTATQDFLSYFKNGTQNSQLISKTRPDDFLGEIKHIISLANGQETNSPLDLELGIQTMQILIAAHHSFASKRTCHIDYNAEITNSIQLS